MGANAKISAKMEGSFSIALVLDDLPQKTQVGTKNQRNDTIKHKPIISLSGQNFN